MNFVLKNKVKGQRKKILFIKHLQESIFNLENILHHYLYKVGPLIGVYNDGV